VRCRLISGTYVGTDATGLLWSLNQVGSGWPFNQEPLFPKRTRPPDKGSLDRDGQRQTTGVSDADLAHLRHGSNATDLGA
jgi:hypothetical protein